MSKIGRKIFYIWQTNIMESQMNSKSEMLKRLLKLFPVKALKDNFPTDLKTQDEIISEIAIPQNSAPIFNFVGENFSLTKQHIHIYNHNMGDNYKNIDATFLPHKPYKNAKSKTEISFFYFYDLPFSVYITDPFEKTEIKFYWPFKVTLDKKHLYIQFVILEKNINSYFPDDRKVVFSEKSIEEEKIVEGIVNHLNVKNRITICDLNKGIKKMWDQDLVDSKYVKYKKSKSTTTEAMDETYTVKKQYPLIYKELINAPLNKTIFQFIDDANDEYCEHFSIDPSEGKISIPTFPKNVIHIDNVVRKIIQLN